MTYSKPDVTVLGNANTVIQGTKVNPGIDPPDSELLPPSFEMED